MKIGAAAEEGTEIIFREVNDIPIRLLFKGPTVYLSGYHKVDTSGLYLKLLEIDMMMTATLRKEHQMIK